MVFNLRKSWDELATGQREAVTALAPKLQESSVREQWDNSSLRERAFVLGVGQIVKGLDLTEKDFEPLQTKPGYFR
ncbi:MAG: hypothetical protein JWO78_63 [Micavibrio sp.]|nr:hypothetical protein [Micavibrio sp.]